MTFGGEPLLYPETVCKIHKAARETGIAKRSVITNGFFSRDRGRIKEVACMLAESRVGAILLSADAFHQEKIPLEYAAHFAECVLAAGVAIRVHPAWLVSEEDNNPYNRKTREIFRAFTQIGLGVSSGNVIFPSGNAKKCLAEYFDERREYVNPYEEEPLDIKPFVFRPTGRC